MRVTYRGGSPEATRVAAPQGDRSGSADAPAEPDIAVDRRLREVAEELLAAHPARIRQPARAIEDLAMGSLARHPGLRAALFRLVDVAPACGSRDELAEHLAALLAEAVDERSDDDARPPDGGGAAGWAASLRRSRAAGGLDRAGRRAAEGALRSPAARPLLGAASRLAVRRMGRRFIVADSAPEAMPVLRALWERGIATSLDLLGEMTVTSAEADAYAERCRTTLRELARASQGWPARDRLEGDDAGPVPRGNLSVKLTALTALLRPEAPARGTADARPRLAALLREAREGGVHLHIDMESFDSRDAVLDLALELLAEPEFASGPSAGVVLQAYLDDAEAQLDRILEWARSHPRASPLTVRLVKGAYWDQEVVEARLRGWEPPVLERKPETDRCFERLTRRLIDARPAVRAAIASHNLRSVAHAIAYAELEGGGAAGVELQVLHGLGDDLRDALAARGLRVRSYCPIGDLVAGMAYLVRRLLENSSNDSFLVQRTRHRDPGGLLAAP